MCYITCRTKKTTYFSFGRDISHIRGGLAYEYQVKFTQKSVQAVQDLEKVAYQFGNQEIEEEHLLYALLEQEDSLILKLIEKMEIDKDYFRNSLNQHWMLRLRYPAVSSVSDSI